MDANIPYDSSTQPERAPPPAEQLGGILESCRERLKQLIQFRLDARIAARVDASDVVQETFLEATRRYPEYQRDPAVPLFIWLRAMALQRVSKARRDHAQREMRDVRREVAIQGLAGETSIAIVNFLLDRQPSPPSEAHRNERRRQIMAAVDSMDALDREVLALRHFEMLDNQETAEALGITPAAASKRHVRALGRLRSILKTLDSETA